MTRSGQARLVDRSFVYRCTQNFFAADALDRMTSLRHVSISTFLAHIMVSFGHH
jgi:hypothetical protein